MMKRLLLSLLLIVGLAAGAVAQGAMSHGEVVKVDAAAGQLKLKHDGVKNLDMPAMSMVFRVKDRSMLSKLKPGDQLRFSAQKIDGQYTVTAIEPAH